MSDFEDYTEEEFYAPVPATEERRRVRDIEDDLRDMLDMVSTAKTMPLSSSALVPREELLDLIEAAIRHLPDEIKRAKHELKAREILMQEQVIKAEQMLDQVQAEAARLVERSEVVRQSKIRAEQIEAEAKAKARTMINEAEDFIDAKLAGFEIVLDRTMKTVASGRDRLASQSLPASLLSDDVADDFLGVPPPAPAPALTDVEPVFDYDAEEY